MKPNKYLLILVATLTAYMLFEYYRPKPLDWSPTYRNDDRIPFGTQALFTLLPDLMRQPAVSTVRMPPYNFLTETRPAMPSNFVFVCRDFTVDRNDLQQLLTYVSRGNNVFISAYNFASQLGTTLGFRAAIKQPTLTNSTLRQNFANPQLRKPGGYTFGHDDGRNYLIVNNKKHVTVLGRNARNEPVFVKIQYGRGHFFIHNLPLAFTNYYVLNRQTTTYFPRALSYLPTRPTYWDEYQKQGRFGDDEQSIFRYIWSQPALRWAYYLVVFGLLLYAIFAGKRTQRVIPVVEPPRNTSLEFVKDVGRLYFQQHDHDNLARKKIQYFLAVLRERYGLDTNKLDREFMETLARKSGVSATETADLVRLLHDAQQRPGLSESDLLTISNAIESFNQTA